MTAETDLRDRVLRGAAILLTSVGASACGSDDSSESSSTLKGDFQTILGGNLTVGGLVELPASSSGRGVQFGLLSGTGSLGAYLGSTSGQSIAYEVRGIPPGTYRILFRVDQVDDGQAEGPGDFLGYYSGTVAEPVMDLDDATPFDLTASRNDIDFGLGIVP